MFLRLIAALPLLLAGPELVVNWSDTDYQALSIYLQGEDFLQHSCLKSGYELRYTFRVQLCRKRAAWLDKCPEERKERHTLSYDPVSGAYRLEVNRFRDGKLPTTRTFSSLGEAMERFGVVQDLSLLFLAENDASLVSSRRSYLSVRVQSDCRGEYNKTLDRIASVLTLGLRSVRGFDTGWLDFGLDRPRSEESP